MKTSKTKSAKRYLVIIPMVILLCAGAAGAYLTYYKTTDTEVVEFIPDNAMENHKKEGKKKAFKPLFEPMTHEQYLDMYNYVKTMPSENDYEDAPINSWRNIGPTPVVLPHYTTTAHNSGKVSDIEYHPISTLRVATGSGGLWSGRLVLLLYSFWNISSKLPTQTIGSFSTHPTDTSSIIVGTGEPGKLYGLGLFKTTNAGANWNQIAMDPANPAPSGFYKVRYSPVNANYVFAATNSGFQVSSNGGNTWVRTLTGVITDLAVHPTSSNIVYATRGYSEDAGVPNGLFRSTNSGLNFVNITPSTGCTNSQMDDSRIEIFKADPQIMYLSVGKDGGQLCSIHKTTNGGTSWQNISAGAANIGQSNRNHVISVSPTNSNLVIWGSLGLQWSTTGGTTWNIQDTIHVDMCRAVWQDGSRVFLGTDGGIYFSSNGGRSYTSIGVNYLSTMEFYRMDASRTQQGIIIGGTQDNGTLYTTNSGANWHTAIGGDGNASTLIPTNPVQMFGVAVANNTWYGTTNTWGSSYYFNAGIDTPNWIVDEAANDRNAPVALYRSTGNYLYRSVSPYTSWTKLNTSAFVSGTLGLGVKKNGADLDVWVTLNKSTGNDRVKFYNGSFFDRAAGIPENNIVRFVTPNLNVTNTSIAVVGSSPSRLFKTNNEGTTWREITGNLNAPISYQGLLFHPTDTNTIYVGTGIFDYAQRTPGFSMFRTTNGGVSWHKWNNGMGEGIIISQLSFIDSTSINGRFYAVAGSYGRGIWVRDINGDDPLTGTNNNNTNLPKIYSLAQNYPNPFNPSTKISFDRPVSDEVTIEVFDISGRLVNTIEKSKMYSAGSHSLRFEGGNLSSGAYFYRITTPRFSDVKKMILVK